MKEEIKNASKKGIRNPLLEASHRHLLETPLHTAPKKVKGQVVWLIGDRWKPMT